MENILSLKNIVKTYPGVKALDNVSLEVKKGEVLALIGENGAGKSTLIKTITGAIQPDFGEINVDGKAISVMTPILSQELGIAAVYQEFNLAASLSVAENLFMGVRINKGPFFSRRQLNKKAQEILGLFNADIRPSTEVKELSVAYMQMVEIAKALARDAKLLIMDEPTAPLTADEVEVLFGIIEKLKERGVTIIYISHRLDELYQVADRVTVMRDGAVIATRKIEDISKDELIYLMVGRELKEQFPVRNVEYGPEILRVENLTGNGVSNISFSLQRGEVLGLAGLVGAGRTETARLIFGADKKESGEIYIDGKLVNIKSPYEAIRNGIGLLTEDRKVQGLLLRLSIKWNISIPILKQLSNFSFIRRKEEEAIVRREKEQLRIKTPSINQIAGNLSGGNQQKTAIGRWLAKESRILIFDEPTRGIDVGAKHEIYQLINRLAAEGLGIIIISSEMEEILGMTDRMIVLAEGRVMGTLEKSEYAQEQVLKYASGEQ